MVVPAGAQDAAAPAQRAQPGPRPDMGWVDHDRLGFNYRLTDLQAAIGVAQLERADALLAARAEAAALYAERLGQSGGAARRRGRRGRARASVRATEDAERRSWFVYAVRLPAAADRDAVVADLAQRGVEAKAYMPCIHLLEPYRERFGHRAGEFPVAEDASQRLLAMPFFPGMTEGQIERCCEALEEALQGDWT